MSMTCYVATPGMPSLFTAHLRKTHRCVQRTEVVFQTKRNCVKSSDYLLERNGHKCPSTPGRGATVRHIGDSALASRRNCGPLALLCGLTKTP
jgi:hypothetical protein